MRCEDNKTCTENGCEDEFLRKEHKNNCRPASRLDLTQVNVRMFRQSSAQVSAAVTRNEVDSHGKLKTGC